MKTKILFTICICAFFRVNLTYARWPQPDPHAENYYNQSPYSFAGNNPVNFVDPDGMNYISTKYFDGKGNLLIDTDDNHPDRVVVVPDNSLPDFQKHLELTDPNVLNSDGWNDYWTETFGEYNVSPNEQVIIDLFHSEKAKNKAIGYLINPSAANYKGMVGSEMLAQWTNPYLLVGGATIGVSAFGSMNPQMNFGRNPNQVYHTFRHIDKIGLSRSTVQNAIRSDMNKIATSIQVGQTVNRIVIVNGQRIQYTVYKLNNGELNIGRIHGK